ncbi:kinase-like domain-containing protein [Syncephalis fuscata]|nr:kinase-like domain-containing protein [Syncephalis fuscata]
MAISKEKCNSTTGWIEVFECTSSSSWCLTKNSLLELANSGNNYQLDADDIPQVCFSVSANDTVACTNIGMQELLVNRTSLNQDETTQHSNSCFIKIPGCTTTFVVYKLRLVASVPVENNTEYDQKVRQNYIIVDEILGKGTFGKVRLGVDRNTLARVAVKFHRVLVTSKASCEKFALCVRWEYAAGGSLHHYTWNHFPLPEMEVKYIFKQLLERIKFLHSKNIIHGGK